jgi:hypothetical protein
MSLKGLILWSDKPGAYSWRSLKPGDDMASAIDIVRQVQSLPALVATLIDLLKIVPEPDPAEPGQERFVLEAQFASLVFNTHGDEGILRLGADEVTSNLVRSELGGKGFERFLKPNATVTFEGCSIAEGPSGELFLVRAGQVFLSRGGGDVKGNTGKGWSAPLLGSTKGFHPFGDWITVRIAAGGTATILNPKHLDMGLINKRLQNSEARISMIEQGKHVPAKDIDILKIRLKNARKYISVGSPSYTAMANICEELDALEASPLFLPYQE